MRGWVLVYYKKGTEVRGYKTAQALNLELVKIYWSFIKVIPK